MTESLKYAFITPNLFSGVMWILILVWLWLFVALNRKLLQLKKDKKENRLIQDSIDLTYIKLGSLHIATFLIILSWFIVVDVHIQSIKSKETRIHVSAGKYLYVYRIANKTSTDFYLKTSNGWMEINQELFFDLKSQGITEY